MNRKNPIYIYCFPSIVLRIGGEKKNRIDLLGKKRDKTKFHGLTLQNLIMMIIILLSIHSEPGTHQHFSYFVISVPCSNP